MGDALLSAGRLVLVVANWLNWACAALLMIGLALTFPLSGSLLHHLAGKYPTIDVVPVLRAMRLMALVALPVAAAVHLVFTRLVAIVDTARARDPFVPANADRLRTIGWALLVLQLADLALGAMTGWLGRLQVDRLDWSPSFTGWFAVLMAFILARVFAVGTAMRDELEHTV